MWELIHIYRCMPTLVIIYLYGSMRLLSILIVILNHFVKKKPINNWKHISNSILYT